MSSHEDTCETRCPACTSRLIVRTHATVSIDTVCVTTASAKQARANAGSAVANALCVLYDAIDDLEGHTVEAKAATAAVELLRSLLETKGATRMETIVAASTAAQKIAEAVA